MKNLLIYGIIACAIAYYVINKLPGNNVTEKMFKERIDKLELQLDSVHVKVDTIYVISKTNRTDIKRINNNVDSLKKGQYVIYKEVSKQKSDFWSKVKDLF